MSNQTYIGYGIGYNYHAVRNRIKSKIHLSYLCDKKFKNNITEYDNIPIIKLEDICKIKDAIVVIFPRDYPIKNDISRQLKLLDISFVFVEEILKNTHISGKKIQEEARNGLWEDKNNNKIYFDSELNDGFSVYFEGSNNVINIKTNVTIDKLSVHMGNNGKCVIGSNSRIIDVKIAIAYASVIIGKDCMFSREIQIRTHDTHPIFDRFSFERLNECQDVIVGDHVWVAEKVLLLSGASIGEGSVIGAAAVTSGTFSDHVIIAGVPAKVIRNNICWSKDSVEGIDYKNAYECPTGDAIRYS